jgi:flavin reductase (DIM6/NTAB) family NADH-FMN oxidoreductase RutF
MSFAVNALQLSSVEDASLREAMRHLALGVSVITAGVGEERTGLTATSVCSFCIDPPTMIVCINRSASAWPVIQRNRHFCLNLLGEKHRDVADRFAGRDGATGPARYEGAAWVTLATGASALADAIAVVDCEVEEIIERHSHAIVLGAVKAVAVNGGEPLVYRDGRYGVFRTA